MSAGVVPTSVSALPTRRTGRVEFVDGVRAVAAFYVVAHHIWITTWPGYPRNTGPWTVGWLLYGHLAVSVFIVVSGFSLAIAPARRGWRFQGGLETFLSRRAWRILPTYWAALIFSAFVYGVVTPGSTGAQITARSLAVHAVLLQDVVNSPKPNGAFWSIALECQIYLFFPIMIWMRRRLGAIALTVAVTGVVVSSYVLAHVVPAASAVLNLTPQFLALFGFGVVAASVLEPQAVHRRRRMPVPIGAAGLPAAAACAAVGFVLLAVVRGSVWIDTEYFWVDLFTGAGVACLLAAMSAHRLRLLAGALSSPPLRAAGRISYSVYLVHLPLLWLVWHFVVEPQKYWAGAAFLALCALGLPLVVVGSTLFSAVFEQPFLTRRSWAAWREFVQRRPVSGRP